MSFIAITYGYNQYSIFNTNVNTYPLLDNIVSTCVDDMLHLLNQKLPTWEDQINNYNQEEDQIKKNIKKLENDKLKDDEKSQEVLNSKPKENTHKEEKNPVDNKKKGKNVGNSKWLILMKFFLNFLFFLFFYGNLDKFFYGNFFSLFIFFYIFLFSCRIFFLI